MYLILENLFDYFIYLLHKFYVMESDLSYLRDQKKTLLSSPTTISLSSVNIGVNRVIPIVYQGGETWSFVIDDADNFIKNHQI